MSQISDLHIPGETIQYFADIDLGELGTLPIDRGELVALSIRIDAAFSSVLQDALLLISEHYDDIPRSVLLVVAGDLALDFIERYGALALLSADVVRVLWEAQRFTLGGDIKRLREVGERLVTFALAAKGGKPAKRIDMGFAFGKPQFLRELEELSHELGASASNESAADQMLRSLRIGKYPSLKQNFIFLEQFLRCQDTNANLGTKNERAAEALAVWGCRTVTAEKGKSMTPDQFFLTWIGWCTNKSPNTVRREINTAKAKLKNKVERLVRVTKIR